MKMEFLDDEIIKMRYMALVKKGIIDDECVSQMEKIELKPCMSREVDKFSEHFVPGTVLLSDKASYKLRIEYPME
jgi:hypothetical protein